VVVDHEEDHEDDEDEEGENTTSAVFHKAEPGRDIFGGQVEKDIHSSAYVQPKVEEKKAEKQVSSVVAYVATKGDGNEVGPFESKPIISSTQSTPATSSSASASNTDTKTKDEPKAREGPLKEADLEAKKAADELFPNDSSWNRQNVIELPTSTHFAFVHHNLYTTTPVYF